MKKIKIKLFSCLILTLFLFNCISVQAFTYSNNYGMWDLYYNRPKPIANEIKNNLNKEMNDYLNIRQNLLTIDSYKNLTFNFTYNNRYVSKWYQSSYGPLLKYLGNHQSEGESKSIEFSKQHFNIAKTVFLGNGIVFGSIGSDSGAFADSKTAASIQNGNPIIINNNINSITPNVKNELNRLKATNLVINGGEGVLGRSLGFGNQFNVIRVGGADRYDTYNLSNICNQSIYDPQKPGYNKDGFTLINNSPGDINVLLEDTLSKYLKEGNMEKIIDILTSRQYGSKENIKNGEPAIIAGVGNQFFIGYYVRKRADNNTAYGVYQFINKDYFLPNLRPKIEIKDSSGYGSVDKIEKDKNYIAKVEIINDGKEDVNDNFDLGFYIEGVRKSELDIQGLKKGEHTFVEIPFKGEDIEKSEGEIEIKVKVDDSDRIEEVFEEDNWDYVKIKVEDPKPEIEAEIIPQKSKCGQRVFFDINTKNYPDKLIIYLPFKDENNPTGKIIIPITPSKSLNTRYEYFLPLDLNKQKYNVRVEAVRTKDNKTADDYPFVEIIGSILDNLKTRRK